MKLVYFSKRPYIFISKTIIPVGGGQGTKHKSCPLDHYLRKKKRTRTYQAFHAVEVSLLSWMYHTPVCMR